MKLYEWDFAPNCRRVRMFLIEKGIEISEEGVYYPADSAKTRVPCALQACAGIR